MYESIASAMYDIQCWVWHIRDFKYLTIDMYLILQDPTPPPPHSPPPSPNTGWFGQDH